MSEKMQIAYLTNHYPAVSHSFIRREILALEALGCAVSRYSIRPPAAVLPDPQDRAEAAITRIILSQGALALIGVAVLTLLKRPVGTIKALACAIKMWRRAGTGLVRHAAYFLEALWLVRALRTDGVDHLHAHFGTNPAAVARIGRHVGGPPYSFTVHGPDEFDNPAGLDLRGKIADSAFCVAISSFGRSQLMRWSDYRHWSKIRVVRCGIDDAFLGESWLQPVPEKHTLCCVARLSAQKGLPLLIQAAAGLKQRGCAFVLTLVGDGDMRAEIEAQIGALGLSENVVITGWASSQEVRDHISASRAMVLPSFAEGLPVVIMEALALQRPVIASAIAGTPELVDASCGMVIPAGDVAAITDAMQAVLEMPVSELQEMGNEGRRRVLARHTAIANAEILLSSIRDARECAA